MAVDGTNSYWIDEQAYLVRTSLADGTVTVIGTDAIYSGSSTPSAIAIDATSVYWSTAGNVNKSAK